MVKKVTSHCLAVPNIRRRTNGRGRAQRACLADFGEDEAFEIVVPLTMLRQHTESGNIRNFMGVLD